MHPRRMRGFSMLEMLIVMSIGIIATLIAFVSLQPALGNSRVTNAYNTTLMAMRQARDTAIAQRQIYFVTFSNAAIPNSITITQGSNGVVTATYFLPSDVNFAALAGIPTLATKTPDQFGTGGTAIDFDQGIAGGTKNVIYFYPDGSAEDLNGYLNNGVIYLGRTGQLYSSRAITVWGATGRLRGWRLYNNAGTPYWRQQ